MGGQRGITRRRVVAGALAIPALGYTAPGRADDDARASTSLHELGLRLERAIRRSRRLHGQVRRLRGLCDDICSEHGIAAYLDDRRRNPAFDAVYRQHGYDTIWQRWSATSAASLDLAEQIRKLPAATLADMGIKHRALLWELYHGQMADAADPEHVRLLKAFGRELNAFSDRR